MPAAKSASIAQNEATWMWYGGLPFLKLQRGWMVVMWQELGAALCLMLVLEGMIPFLYPGKWRQLVQKLAEVDNQTMRMAGFFSMVVGATLLYVLKH